MVGLGYGREGAEGWVDAEVEHEGQEGGGAAEVERAS